MTAVVSNQLPSSTSSSQLPTMNGMASNGNSRALFAQSEEETADPLSTIIEAHTSSDVGNPAGDSGNGQPESALTEEALRDRDDRFRGGSHRSGRRSINNANRGSDQETDYSSVHSISSDEESLEIMSDIEQRNREATLEVGRDLPPLKQRLRKANKRVLQHQSYIRLVEDRLATLETAMAKLKRQRKPQSRDEIEVVDEEEIPRPVSPIMRTRHSSISEVAVEEDPFKVVPEIARMPLESFRPPQPKAFNDQNSSVSSKHPIADAPLTPLHVIEVCTSVPTGPSNTRRARSRHPSVTSTEPADDRGNAATEPDLLARVPDRVRIRSIPLLKTLEKISDGKFVAYKPERENRRRRRVAAHPPIRSAEGAEVVPPVVFLRPFKLFVEFEDKIRAYTKELEVKWNVNNASPEAIPAIHIEGDEAAAAPIEDITMSKEALTHLQLLIEFLDFDLKGLFQLRRQVKEGTLKTIAFADLWLLFSHGDEVCTNQYAAQVYRILHFTGGRKYLNSGLDDEIVVRRRDRTRDRDRYGPPRAADPYYEDSEVQYLTPTKKGSDFVIQCFSFDYDGFDYGPSQQIFSILWYEGEVPITSLTVFPHRFRDVNGRIPSIAGKPIPTKQELIQRGKRFVKLSKVMHMQYKGRCIGTGDEVRYQYCL